MRSLLLFALLACLSSAVAAVEAGLPSANGSGECPSQQVAAGALSGAPTAAGAASTPAVEASPRGDAEENTTTGTRQRGTVRWHSLLPGMVR